MPSGLSSRPSLTSVLTQSSDSPHAPQESSLALRPHRPFRLLGSSFLGRTKNLLFWNVTNPGKEPPSPAEERAHPAPPFCVPVSLCCSVVTSHWPGICPALGAQKTLSGHVPWVSPQRGCPSGAVNSSFQCGSRVCTLCPGEGRTLDIVYTLYTVG